VGKSVGWFELLAVFAIPALLFGFVGKNNGIFSIAMPLAWFF
jgi:hypothetical protein